MSLYLDTNVVRDDVDWLRAHDYLIFEFDCRRWESMDRVHDDLSTTLAFPEWYGRNLNAFAECLSDIAVPGDGGVAFVLREFDAFSRRFQHAAQSMLDIIEDCSRFHLLFGDRVFALVQVTNPEAEFAPVGSRPVGWNRREWLRSNRGLPPRPPISMEPGRE